LAVTDWIDQLTRLWEITDFQGGTVKSYFVFEKDEFPASLSEFPCALTYTQGLYVQYAIGDHTIQWWRGVTEFHITPDVSKQHIPYVMRFFNPILSAAAGSMTLNSTCTEFGLIRSEDDVAIEGPLSLQYGEEAPHWALRVFWKVKHNITGTITVAM
jgi:hypothetical protein